MKIDKVDNISYKGMYRLPNKPEYVEAFSKHVFPAYANIRKEPVIMFSGNNPFVLALKILMKEIAETNNSSVDWLKMNAKNFGIDLTETGDDVLHIITTEKDTKRLVDFMIARITPQKETLMDKIKNIFSSRAEKESKALYDRDLPQHLKIMAEALGKNAEEAKAFGEFAKDEISVSEPKELFRYMMTEKPY